ncbi:MAG: EscU/YscU/HrcU family type III secretion system export apparatus switch protein [Gammaproteobacteria bacterium]|nr:EscU/YscU/HrcU family type III secretion system export apparatus switch protein [Gammaproteobacteria bacterium]
MSEDSGEKTEQPTETKLRNAREKGQVAQSKDASTAVVVLLAFVYLWLGWEEHLERFEKMMILPAQVALVPFDQAYDLAFKYASEFWKAIMLPLIVIIVAGGALIGFLVAGPVFSMHPLTPDFTKISPANGFKQLFSLKKLLEVFKGLIVFVLFCIVFSVVFLGALPAFTTMQSCDLNCFSTLFGSMTLSLLAMLVLVLVVTGALDIWIQKNMFVRSMRMTKDEVKREYKQREGDPMVKSQRNQLAKEMNENAVVEIKLGTIALAAGAQTVVVLYYKRDETPLPIVIAKGAGPGAAEIFAELRRHDVSIRDEPKLARQLFSELGIGQPLKDEHIKPVAAVMSSLGI